MSDFLGPIQHSAVDASDLPGTENTYGITVSNGLPQLLSPNPGLDLGGNQVGNATSLEFSGNLAVIEDWIGVDGDIKDYYAFRVDQAGTVELSIDGLSDNVNMRFYRADGERVGQSYAGGTKRDVITGNFGVGDYYVELFGKTSAVQTSYQLSVVVPAAVVEPEPTPIEPSPTEPLPIDPVVPESVPTASTPDPLSDRAGGTTATATALTFQNGVALASDWIGAHGDRKDYYAFTLDHPGEVMLTLDGLSDNANLQLSDARGDRITASYQGGTKNDVITRQLAAGTYYASVFGKTSEVETLYQLSVKTDAAVAPVVPAPQPEPEPAPSPEPAPLPQPEPAPEPTGDLAGDTIATAFALNFQNGVAQVNDGVGMNGDSKDYYAFTLDHAGDVSITLSGLSDNANLQLSDAKGDRITASYQGGTKNDVITRQLEAGTYYASVFGKTSEVETLYQLSVETDAAVAPVEPAPLPAPEPAPVPEPAPIVEPEPAPQPAPQPTTDLAGNTLGTAFALAFQNGVAQINEGVGLNGDSKDYYAFTLDSAGEVTITLAGLSDNANLQLSDAKGDRIRASYQGGTKNDVITEDLAAGTYYISVFGKTATVSTTYDLTVETTAAIVEPAPVPSEPVTAPTPEPIPEPAPEPIDDWFGQNIQDVGLAQLARDRFADGKIDRLDMIDLLRAAGDGDVVDSQEFADLQTLVGAVETLNLDDYVANLSDKVVNGNRANQWFTGGEQSRQDLGNLEVGSDAAQLDKLVGKWFFGSDRPTTLSTSHQYEYIAGDLFQDGVDFTDVIQAKLGDCYFMVVLASAAQNTPGAINDMFIDNGDGTFTVRFFNNGNAEYVTVDRYLPTLSWSGKSPYAQYGDDPTSASNELWAALAEKAYAQFNESGSILQDGTNTYKGIEGGWMSGPTKEVLGTASRTKAIDRTTPEDVIAILDSDAAITVGIDGDGQHGVVDDHAYTLTEYDAETQTFHLENPWGDRHVDLTWEQMETMDTYFVWST